MYEDKNNNDIERILRRSGRKRRSARVPAAVYAGIAALVLIAAGVIGRGGKKPGDPAQTAQTGAVQAGSQEETTLSPEEQARAEHEAMIEDVIASYDNLGIVTVEGSLNIHEAGAQESDIIGKLTNGSACDILDTTPEGWLHISSGGLEGYVHPDYVKTGEEARALAKEEIALRAIVLADRLIIRKEPTTYIINENYDPADYDAIYKLYISIPLEDEDRLTLRNTMGSLRFEPEYLMFQPDDKKGGILRMLE